jgi:hypothetical protein
MARLRGASGEADAGLDGTLAGARGERQQQLRDDGEHRTSFEVADGTRPSADGASL